MPAKSKSQQRLFGMVHAYKKGELDTDSVNSELLTKIKKIAGGIEDKSAKKFAKTKHNGLPELKETRRITFKEFLTEQFTEKQRQILTPPVVVQKIFAEIKRKYGIVEKEIFYSKLAERLNLTPRGLKRLLQLPAIRALPFDDQSQDEPGVALQEPWGHVAQKYSNRP